MEKFCDEQFKTLNTHGEKIEYAVSYLGKIAEMELLYGCDSWDLYDEYRPDISQLDLKAVKTILETFVPVFNQQDGVKLNQEIHKEMIRLLSDYDSKPTKIRGGEIAEMLAFILIKGEELEFQINAADEFKEYIQIIRIEQNRAGERQEQELIAKANAQYNLCMAWQDGEIDDEEYWNNEYSY